MVLKDGKVLLGKRKGSHGDGEYGWPGGHLEYMESIVEAAKREVREEAGIEIKNVKFLRLLNLKDYPPKHYVDIGLVADWESGDAKLMEPDRSEGWDWYDLDKLPSPLFKVLTTYLEAYKTGRNFFDE